MAEIASAAVTRTAAVLSMMADKAKMAAETTIVATTVSEMTRVEAMAAITAMEAVTATKTVAAEARMATRVRTLATAGQRITRTADMATRMVAPVAEIEMVATDTVAATLAISSELTNDATATPADDVRMREWWTQSNR